MHAQYAALFAMCRFGDQRVHIYVSEEARRWKHFEDGRGVYIVSVRIRPKWNVTTRKGTSADPIHSSFASMCTVYQQQKAGMFFSL